MAEIKIGNRVVVRGDTQHYILVDPEKTHTGEVVGKDEGQLLVKLDKPVKRGSIEFGEVTVPQTSVSISQTKKE